jgi:hypothetical protein
VGRLAQEEHQRNGEERRSTQCAELEAMVRERVVHTRPRDGRARKRGHAEQDDRQREQRDEQRATPAEAGCGKGRFCAPNGGADAEAVAAVTPP